MPSVPPSHSRPPAPRARSKRWQWFVWQVVEYGRHAGLWPSLRRALQILRFALVQLARGSWRILRANSSGYANWRRIHEPGEAVLMEQGRLQSSLQHRPLFSLLLLVDEHAPARLARTFASIRLQTYTSWELWVVGDHAALETGTNFARASAVDQRVRLMAVAPGSDHAAGLNAALARAAGDYVLVLEQAEQLAPNLLFEMAQLLNAEPGLDVIYADEDQVDKSGLGRQRPWFKPARWSPALALSVNPLRAAALRCHLARQVGGFDPVMAEALSWDLALRIVECAGPQRLAHLPVVGIHASLAVETRPALDTARRVVAAHLQRTGADGAVVSVAETGRLRVEWPIPRWRVCIVIVTRDEPALLHVCLESIFKRTAYEPYEIILVDVGSVRSDTRAYYDSLAAERRPVSVIRRSGEGGLYGAANLGARSTQSDCVVFLSRAAECFDAGWLAELLGWAAQPGIGLVGARLVGQDGRLQHAGVVVGFSGIASSPFAASLPEAVGPNGSPEWYRDVLAVSGACLAVRREVFEQLGGFDEGYHAAYGDLELGLRAVSAGLRVIYNPFACLRLRASRSLEPKPWPTDLLRALWQARPIIRAGDPLFGAQGTRLPRQPNVADTAHPEREIQLEQALRDWNLVEHPAVFSSTRPGTSTSVRHFVPALDSRADIPQKSAILVSNELGLTGAPQMLARGAAALRRTGWAVTVLAPEDGQLREILTQAGVGVWVEPAVLRDASVLHSYLAGGCQLVVANTILAWRAVLAASAAQIPSLWWIHEARFGQKHARSIPGIDLAFKYAGRVVFPSEAAHRLYDRWVDPQRVAIIPNGVEMPARSAASPGWQAKDGRITVVSLGSVEPNKNQVMLVKSIAALPPVLRAKVQVQILGRTENTRYQRQVQAFADRHLPGQLTWRGVLPHHEAQTVLQQADVFVLASRDEAQSVSLLEALAAGVPAIATRVGGVVEIVQDGVNGLLVPSDDGAALTAALARLASDEALRRALSASGRAAVAERFTVEIFQQRWLAAVDDLLAAWPTQAAPPVTYRVAAGPPWPGPVLETDRTLYNDQR